MSNEWHNKRAIAQAFGRAAQRYTRFAELQRTSGEHLMTLALPLAGQRILYAGWAAAPAISVNAGARWVNR